MILVSGKEMKEIDRTAIEDHGISGLRLMETAGIRVFEAIQKELNDKDQNVLIVCGAGNNGGDGYVVARKLIQQFIPVKVYSTVNPNKLKGDAKANYQRLKEMGIDIYPLNHEENSNFKNDVDESDIIVDAILGTGLSRPVSDELVAVFNIINQSSKKIFSIDIPSGIGAETGRNYGSAIQANKTITFQLPKLGCILYPGSEHTGELIIVDIGIPQKIIDKNHSNIYTIEEKTIKNIIKPRQKELHKGNCGKLIIIAGSKGMAGAAVLTAKSALRSGAGLVKIAVPESITDILQISVPEAICISLKGSNSEQVNEENVERIIKNAMSCNAIAIGPGLGSHNDIKKLLKNTINTKKPIVIDADGLNAISDEPGQVLKKGLPIIITPHPGEMSRLTGLDVKYINENRIEVTRNFSKKWGIIVVLKGARTTIGLPDGTVFVNVSGNPGMATGGSGDALTGIISSFCAQGLCAEHAAIASVYIHGRAGDIMAKQYGEYGLCAGDLTIGTALAIKEIFE